MKSLSALVCIALLALGCKKPFTPALDQSGNKRYLVVEGSITGTDSTIIKLSKTKLIDTSKTALPETNAIVTIENDANDNIPLSEVKPGIYAAQPFNLDAAHNYRLRIKTSDSKEYVSDYVTVKNSPPIDSIGFAAQASVLQIYVNSHDDANATRYYRWDYSETWQFHSQYSSSWTKSGARKVEDQIYHCFASDTSTSVTIASTIKLGSDILYHAPVTSIDPASEKIETKYSILVKQFALSSDAYAFWQNLQKNTQKIGSVFDVLPSEAPTNYHCVTDPGELVVGYLSVGNVSYKRIFITKDQLPPSYQTVYPTACELDTAFIVNPPKTLNEEFQTNQFLTHDALYEVVQGLYLPPPNPFGGPTALSYSTKLCVDCTIRGTTKAPLFWK
jgi:hypothetical protein